MRNKEDKIDIIVICAIITCLRSKGNLKPINYSNKFSWSLGQEKKRWSGWSEGSVWSGWSGGQVVRWSGGQVVRWLGGQVVRWLGGQVVSIHAKSGRLWRYISANFFGFSAKF